MLNFIIAHSSFVIGFLTTPNLKENALFFYKRNLHKIYYTTSGNVTDEVIMKYIEEQGKEPPDGDFKIDGAL